MKHKIYQIFYDRKTADQILPGLIPYDNSKPINSSWYEYSVIRDILQKNKIGDDDYLGILSPRFFDKTGINGEALLKILDKSSSDVISFSSDIWSNARYLNSVLQAESHHPGIFHLTKKILSKLDIPLNLEDFVQDQTRIIFSNYFVAKYSFWKKWFVYSEAIYSIAENEKSELSFLLNSNTMHRNNNIEYQYKIFVLERLVSFVLELNDINACIGLDLNKYKESLDYKNKERYDLALTLDALKSQFIKTKKIEFLILHKQILENFYKSK